MMLFIIQNNAGLRDRQIDRQPSALWFSIAMNEDVSIEPLARPFACSFAPLTYLLALQYSLC